jgi:hypothetical protein
LKKAKIDLKDLEPMFLVGMSESSYPGSTLRILQDADREPAVISFVADWGSPCFQNKSKGSLTKA